jgi:type IV pilus assembly protein PilM
MNKLNLKLESHDDDLPTPAPQQKPVQQLQQEASKPKPAKKVEDIDYVKDPGSLFLNKIDNIFSKLNAKSKLVIEIGQSDIRVMHLFKVKHQYNIGYWAVENLTPADFQNPETIILTLKKLIDKKLIKSTDIILSLYGPEVIIRTLTVPKLEGKELRDAIFWKNKNDLPNLSDDALWDYEIVGEVEEDKKRVYNVLSIIAYDAFVRKYLILLGELNIYPNMILTKPISLHSALQNLTYEWAVEEKTTVLAEIGKETTLLNFYRDGKLEFVRSIMLGSNKIDSALDKPIKFKDKHIKLHPDKIEIYKQKHGILLELLSGNTTKSFFPYNQLFEFIKPILQMFVSELKRSFTFYLNSYNHDQVDLLFITGGGTKLKNIDKFLEMRLDVPVHTIAPSFPSIVQGSYKPGYEYTACFGAASRKEKSFNFIPKDIKTENKYRQVQNTLKIAVSLVFAIILVYSSFIFFDEKNYTTQVNDMEQQYQGLHISEIKYNEVLNQVRAQEKKKQDLLGNVSTDPKIINILKIFSNLTPQDIALTSIDFFDIGSSNLFENVKIEESMVVIKGNIYKNFLSADITLIEFMNNLKELNYFKEITLAEKSKRINERIFLFKIHCKI